MGASMIFKRFTVAVAALFVLLAPASAAGLYPLSNYQQFDANGKLMVGARLYLFNGGTSTPRIGYKDSSLTSPHPNPIVADASGRLPLIYLDDGFYRQRLTTKSGVQVFDQDGLPVVSTTSGGSGTSVDPDSVYKTGDFKIAYDNQPVSGYVRANGRTIGNVASGATERANLDTQPLYEKLWAFANITVSGGKGASATADFVANKTLVLPNAAGRGLFGMDDLGGGAQSVLTSASISTPTVVGTSGGFQTATIAQSNIPNYTLTGGSGSVSASGVSGTESALHTHSGNGTTGTMSTATTHVHGYTSYTSLQSIQVGSLGTIPNVWAGTQSANTTSTDTNHTHDFSYLTGTQSGSHTHNVSVTGTAASVSILSGGSGTAMAILPPVLLLMIYIRL